VQRAETMDALGSEERLATGAAEGLRTIVTYFAAALREEEVH
jgi:hypothetical protein